MSFVHLAFYQCITVRSTPNAILFFCLYRATHGVSVYQFPLVLSPRRELWVEILQTKTLPNRAYACESHFSPSSFKTPKSKKIYLLLGTQLLQLLMKVFLFTIYTLYFRVNSSWKIPQVAEECASINSKTTPINM